MAIFIRNREDLEQQLIMMKTQKGMPIRALARQFAISRNMVRRIYSVAGCVAACTGPTGEDGS